MIPQSGRCHTILWLAPDPFSTTLPVPRDKHAPRWYGNITHLFTFCILSSIIVKVWFQLLFFHTIIQFCCRKWHELWDAITTGLKQFRKSISKMFKLIASCLHEFSESTSDIYNHFVWHQESFFISIIDRKPRRRKV